MTKINILTVIVPHNANPKNIYYSCINLMILLVIIKYHRKYIIIVIDRINWPQHFQIKKNEIQEMALILISEQ